MTAKPVVIAVIIAQGEEHAESASDDLAPCVYNLIR